MESAWKDDEILFCLGHLEIVPGLLQSFKQDVGRQSFIFSVPNAFLPSYLQPMGATAAWAMADWNLLRRLRVIDGITHRLQYEHSLPLLFQLGYRHMMPTASTKVPLRATFSRHGLRGRSTSLRPPEIEIDHECQPPADRILHLFCANFATLIGLAIPIFRQDMQDFVQSAIVFLPVAESLCSLQP